MQAEHLIDIAIQFATQLNETFPSRVICKPETTGRVFADVYHEPMPDGSGVYLFHFADRDVFYIGKTNTQERTFEKRVWAHFYAPALTESGQREIRAKHIDVAKLAPEEQKGLTGMQFRIDYFKVDPPELADLFEVYLQSICFLRDGKLPKCNAQFG